MGQGKHFMMTGRSIGLSAAALLVALTAPCWGTGLAQAEEAPATSKNVAERGDSAAANKADAAAKRALAKRAEMLKQRKEAREYIRKVVEGQQPAATTAAPNNAGMGGNK